MTDPAAATPAANVETDLGICQNCGTPLLGPHCYHCGQPIKGLVRHFGSIMGDFFDSVLDFDERTLRTLWPLFAKPGFLSREYFAGRRARFVSPVRLFVFLSIVTFFVAQLTLDLGDDAVNFDNQDNITKATTVADVEATRDAALEKLLQARKQIPDVAAGGRAGIDEGIAKVKQEAQKRIETLQRAERDGKPPPKAEEEKPNISFNGGTWDPVTNPVKFDLLPAFANRWINTQVGRGQENVVRLQKDPSLLVDTVLGALPSTLFVLLPIFALMLKIAYLFKRRLYMEHLIVALHSHAFLCLALLPMFGFGALARVWPAADSASNLLDFVLLLWMPIYLLLMQKRVYGQGWMMTLLKYFVLGVCYLILLSMGIAVTVLISLVWM